MTDHVSHVDFPSKKLVTAFEKALVTLRAEHRDERRRMTKMHKLGETDREDYTPSRTLKNAYKTVTSWYAPHLIQFLSDARTSGDQLEEMATALEHSAHNLLYSQMSPTSHARMIRLYELADQELTRVGGRAHPWHTTLTAMIEQAKFDGEAFASLTALAVQAQQKSDSKVVFDTIYDAALDELLKAHPEIDKRRVRKLTEDENKEVEARVDAMVSNLLEPYQPTFGAENMDTSQAWFIERALKLHTRQEAGHAQRFAQRGAGAVNWIERVGPAMKLAVHAPTEPLRVANDTDGAVAAHGMIRNIFDVVRASSDGITDYGPDHYLKAKAIFEAKARALNTSPESGVAYRF